jgi:hypothetical protein
VTLGEEYLELALRFGKAGDPGVVDSYSGPPELKERVDAEDALSPSELLDETLGLASRVDAEATDPVRRRWLAAQLSGIEAACRRLAGEEISFRELVFRCYGIEPDLVPEEVFADAHGSLDAALPGNGDVRERAQRWLATQVVPTESIGPGLDAATEHLRTWTTDAVGLPEGESVELRTTTGERWFGLAEYEGGLRTRITMNTDIPIWSYRLGEFVSHEIYPGHHTENVWKQAELISGRGYLELAVFAAPAQKALLTEGMADLGFAFGFGEDGDQVAAELFRPLGIPYDPERAAAVRRAKLQLAPLGLNLRILLDERQISLDGAWRYLRRWSLESDDYVARIMRNIEEQPWQPYTVANALGQPLCRRWVGGDPGKLKRLLAEQLTTEDLL